jgi:tRNA threonylcarbamoyladenosine dehydratase
MRRDAPDAVEADLERRFGGLKRLWGEAGYARVRSARVAVVGVGGVGSWAAEALARCGVAGLVLIDLDHVSESNINRQVQADSETLGAAKVLALRERIARIHPACRVDAVEAFVEEGNWPQVVGGPVDAVIDACDEARAKAVMARAAIGDSMPLVCVGAAGGKQHASRVEVEDLAQVTHDPLLASLRQRLRREGAPRQGRIGIRCVFSKEAVLAPSQACDVATSNDGTLNCHGYGSSVTVTATFGMVAADEALRIIRAAPDQHLLSA